MIGDYGLDSPAVLRGLGLTATAALLVTVVSGILDLVTVMAVAFGATVLISAIGLVMLRSSRVHKIRERVLLVDRLALRGDERVLDVGCGRGLLLVEVARRLNRAGRAFGVDVWHATDGIVVEADHALHNAELEDVDHRIDVTSADVRSLPYADASFAAVVSGLALHHIEGFASRVQVCREMSRVLEPGGKVVLIDRHHTRSYVDALRAGNLINVRRSRLIWRLLPPARYVTATKPMPAPRRFATEPAEPEMQEPVMQEPVMHDSEPVPTELPVPLPQPMPELVLEPAEVGGATMQLQLSDAVTGERDGAEHEEQDGPSM